MSVTVFFTKSGIVSRLKDVGDGKRNMTTTATVDGALQELDARARTELDMVQDRGWRYYTNIENEKNIQVGDRITIDGRNYQVSEITLKDYAGSSNQHIEVLLIESQSDE